MIVEKFVTQSADFLKHLLPIQLMGRFSATHLMFLNLLCASAHESWVIQAMRLSYPTSRQQLFFGKAKYPKFLILVQKFGDDGGGSECLVIDPPAITRLHDLPLSICISYIISASCPHAPRAWVSAVQTCFVPHSDCYNERVSAC